MTWEQELKHRERIVREEALEEGREEGLAQGLSQGEQKKALETAKNFLTKDIAPAIIAECTGLTLEQVLALQTN